MIKPLNDQNKTIWYYDIELRMCKRTKSDCVLSNSLNKFDTNENCKSKCIPNVNEVQTQGIF